MLSQLQVAKCSLKGACSRTNNDGLWALIARHVDGGSGAAGGDGQRRVEEIQLDRDATGWWTAVVAHLDLDRENHSQ